MNETGTFLLCSLIVLWARDYADRQQCVCSILTTEEQTYAIDDRLYRVCEKDTMNSGTFMIVRTTWITYSFSCTIFSDIVYSPF